MKIVNTKNRVVRLQRHPYREGQIEVCEGNEVFQQCIRLTLPEARKLAKALLRMADEIEKGKRK